MLSPGESQGAGAVRERRCPNCGFGLGQAGADVACPQCGLVESDPTGRSGPVASPGVRCCQCGYDLSGLPTSGQCPECGAAIYRSIQGDFLEFSSPEYLKRLHWGAILVQASLILLVFQIVVPFIVGAILTLSVARASYVFLGASAFALLGSLAGLGGWWLLSATDPRFAGENTGQGARLAIRITVIVLAGITLLQAPFGLISAGMAGPSTLGIVSMAISLASFIAQIAKYFASLLYLQWLAKRIPDWRIDARARLLLWLGPVLIVFGAVLFLIGPIVTLVLYYNMLDWVRTDLRKIRAASSPAAAASDRRSARAAPGQ